MLTEDYCSFEVSKLLKEKGFDFENQIEGIKKLLSLEHNEIYFTVTHALVMKWLREKWIFIEISFSITINGEPCYNFGILSRSAQWIYRHKQSFSSYEEAVEAALKHSLTNLI